jgi:hypothetical protein
MWLTYYLAGSVRDRAVIVVGIGAGQEYTCGSDW